MYLNYRFNVESGTVAISELSVDDLQQDMDQRKRSINTTIISNNFENPNKLKL